MSNLIRRNILLFFRDKASVFFSFLAVIIILALYILFLGNTMDFGIDDPGASKQMGDAWIMSGLVAVTSVTTTMGAFGTMVVDRKSGIFKDFYCAPVKHSTIAIAYVISAIIVGLMTTLLTLVAAEAFIVANGGALLTPLAFLKVIGLIIVSVFSGCSFVLFLVSFFNSVNAFATASSIVGSLIGFIAGLYIPIGVLPSYLQTVIKVFPVSHSAMLLRQVFVEPVISKYMSGMPEAVTKLKAVMGIAFYAGDKQIPTFLSFLILLVSTVLFFVLASLRLSRKQK